MNKEVIYIAELDADVDDVIAAEYLHNKGVLKEYVMTRKILYQAFGRAKKPF